LSNGAIAASNVIAIGIANQRETTVLWDRSTGKPLANAIVWQDRRTAERCDGLRRAGHASAIQEKTGLELDAYFSATKLQWLLENIPNARARAERGELAFGTIDSWLVFNLTGGKRHVTDPSNAARTMLFNIREGVWDDDLLRIFEVPPQVLPEVVASSGICGRTEPELFGTAIPIAGIAGDQQAATFGQSCHRTGMAKNTYGTGCFILLNTGDVPVQSKNRLLTTIGWRLGPKTTYMLEGGVFMGGAIVQWLRDGLKLIGQAGDVEALAVGVADSGGVVMVPAFAGLGAPYWDPYARGTLLGMTRGTTGAHIARAALDAIALQCVDLLDATQRDSGVELLELRVDGGACRNDLLMQTQADLLGVPVVRPQITETTALGAAYLAGLATQMWSDVEELYQHWRIDRRFEPTLSCERRDETLSRWRKSVDLVRSWQETSSFSA
jgi:glycerol kinase